MSSCFFTSNSFQLICMLICIAVVACTFIFFYSKGKDIQDSDSRLKKAHIFYVSGILIFIIIELVTSLCMGNARHSEILSYVSFAATLSSLIMSVVAIIFTIVYSSRSAEHLDKMDKASFDITHSLDDFKTTSLKLSDSIDDFSGTSNTVVVAVGEFRKESQALGDRIDSIFSRLDRIEQKTDKAYEAASMKADTKNETNTRTNAELKEYLNHCSFVGALVLLACALSKEKNKEFVLDVIADNMNTVYYMYGFVIATQASGFISVSVDDANREIKVMSCAPELRDIAKKELERRLKTYKENRPHFEGLMKTVVSFFE